MKKKMIVCFTVSIIFAALSLRSLLTTGGFVKSELIFFGTSFAGGCVCLTVLLVRKNNTV